LFVRSRGAILSEPFLRHRATALTAAMQRLVYALDLQEDPQLIAEYEAWHRADRIWPAVVESLRASGMAELELYRTGTRLFLIIEAPDGFSPHEKARADAANPRVQAWEQLMWVFQRPLPWAAPGQKWVPMQRIFRLSEVAARLA
jgi:L-rhamnose mutarotase